MCLSVTAMAQMKVDFGSDSPLRKLQIAEMAITNLYVDSVDEKKLVEDGIRGMLEKLDTPLVILHTQGGERDERAPAGQL